jgi:hypothetical protein
MSQEQTVFSQILQFVPYDDFRICVRRYDGNKGVRRFSCWEQFLAMAFAQFTHRESLRDIEVCLAAHQKNLYRAGFRSLVKRSTLADANENRDWRIYADFAHSLIKRARPLYADTDLGLDLDATIYALDATTIDLCLSLFPWAPSRYGHGGVKLHTMIDIQGAIPVFIDITHARTGDVLVLDKILPQPGSYIVMDRGYIDFERLYRLNQALTYFVIRAKGDLQFRRRYSRRIDKSTGLRCDQTIVLTGPKTSQRYPIPLRRVSYYAAENDTRFVFLTNDFFLPPLTVAAIYRHRWHVELFFKWIKQHLRIKAFIGQSANAVKVQIWTAICAYVMVAIIKKRLNVHASLHAILQTLSLNLFEKVPLQDLLGQASHYEESESGPVQLALL